MVCALAVSASCRLAAAKFYTPSGSTLRAILDVIRDANFVRIILGALLVSFIPKLCFNSGALPIHEILPVQEEMPRYGCHGYIYNMLKIWHGHFVRERPQTHQT